MKLADLPINQSIIVQIVWGEQKIEFSSEVIEHVPDAVYVTSYKHNGSELQLNITEETDVVCNVFTNKPATGQRVSWRNVELTTVERNNNTCVYSLRTRGFNHVANPDDRRYNERTVIDISGTVTDKTTDETISVTVHDISGVGISYYAPQSYEAKSQQVVIMFTDNFDDKSFNIKVDASISRTSKEIGHVTVGCRLSGENRDYQLYRLIKHLKEKKGTRTYVLSSENATGESEAESVDSNESEKKAESIE